MNCRQTKCHAHAMRES